MPYPLLLLLLLFPLAAHVGACSASDRAALLRVRGRFTSGEIPVWPENSDCCLWDGVACSSGGEVVISLDLSDRALSGAIDSSLFALVSLRSLNLAHNLFDGTQLPSSGFERLTNLTHLNLSNAGFAGPVPPGVAALRRLVSLDLSTAPRNAIPGSSLSLTATGFRNLVAGLQNLHELRLDNVNMSAAAPGTTWAPVVAAAAPHLRVLSLSGCSLSGPIDLSLSKLHSLEKLHLDHNNLSCDVPPFLARFSYLSALHLQSCNLIGEFPSEIIRLPSLVHLDASDNPSLAGELPEFTNSSALESLVLRNTNFHGVLPPSMAANLTQLVHLDLSQCNFSGVIPTISQWSRISVINLSHNQLIGSIPEDDYSVLGNLVEIDLRGNSLSSAIPDTLFSSPSMQRLQLSQNGFSDTLPEVLNPSLALQVLDLGVNDLEGPMPDWLFRLAGLRVLNLSSNRLTGVLELDLLQRLVNLSSLDLSGNVLSAVDNSSGGGNLSLGSYPMISTVKLASCNLTSIPGFLRQLEGMASLDLSDNRITGTIPQWIWSIGNSSFNYLNLSHNWFSTVNGPQPANLQADTTLALDLSHNMLEGDLPLPPPNTVVLDYSNNRFASSISPELVLRCKNAVFLSLSNNQLTGVLPPSICELNANSLEVLDLSDNRLTGIIPRCLMTGDGALQYLNLGNNRFNGSVPDNITRGCALQAVDLSGNELDGVMPRSLTNCSALELLDLGGNKITGGFPYWLRDLSWLRVLILRSNSFSGSLQVPEANPELSSSRFYPMLQILDVSSNRFNGVIPVNLVKSLKAMTALPPLTAAPSPEIKDDYLRLSGQYYRSSVTVTVKGFEITLSKFFVMLTSLDLSSNELDGTIPADIGELKLLYSLNLSNNGLDGGIPSELANLAQLESLDLSSNRLIGEIPPSLTSLTFLSTLNLSDNQLDGPIPESTQFQTFNGSSFLGNPGLCGFPLPLQCPSAPPSTHSPASPAPSRLKMGTDWQMIVVGVGYGGGSALVLCGKGRQWCNALVDAAIVALWGCCCSCRRLKRVETNEDDGYGSNKAPARRGSREFCVKCTGLEFNSDFRVVIVRKECTCSPVLDQILTDVPVAIGLP